MAEYMGGLFTLDKPVDALAMSVHTGDIKCDSFADVRTSQLAFLSGEKGMQVTELFESRRDDEWFSIAIDHDLFQIAAVVLVQVVLARSDLARVALSRFSAIYSLRADLQDVRCEFQRH